MYGLGYQDNMPARSLARKLVVIADPKNKTEHYTLGLSKYFFTRSQIRTKDWSDLNTKEQRLEAIGVLIKNGHISKEIDGKYYINPKHLEE